MRRRYISNDAARRNAGAVRVTGFQPRRMPQGERMEVIPGSTRSNGNGNLPPTGKSKPAAGEKARGAAKGEGKRARGRGRQDADKQPAAKQPKIISERLDELVDLHNKAKNAGERSADAIAKAAEDSGYLASAVRKLVTAKAGDKFEEKHREVEQQGELFDEVAA